ncbi:MAG: hypothetical protein ACOVJ8_08865 [Sediminibacterium sp.]
MAQEIEVKVKVTTEQAVNSVDKLGDAFDQTAKDAKEAQEVFAKAGNGVKVEESIAGLKQLKRELKNVAVGSEEFKIIYNQIDDLEDKLKSAKNVSSDWVDSLESAGGPLGMLGASINKAKVATQSFGGALKATGIGLVVALLAGLAGAFANNEGAMKKLQPLLDGVSKLFQGVFRAVEPVFNTLVDLAISALPMVQKAFGSVYSVVTATLQSFGAIGSAIGKLMDGDFKGAWNSAKSSVSDFGKNYDASLKRFESGAKELTKTEKEQSDKRAEERKAAQEKRQEEEQKLKDKQAEERAKELEEQKAFDDETLKQIAEFNRAKIDAAVQNDIEEAERKAKSLEDISAMVDAMDAKELADTKAQSEAKIKIAELEAKQKDDLLKSASDSMDAVAEIVGKNTVAGKSLAVASALINTYQGISAGVKLGYPQAIPAVLMASITGFKAVKSIMSVKVPAAGGGGGGGGSVPSSISLPSAMPVNPQVVGESGVNQLASTLGNQAPVKAYVVAKDVTSQQSLDRNITDTATLG